MKQRFSDTDWRRVGHLTLMGVLVIVLIPFIANAIPQIVGASNSYVVLSNSMADDPAPVLETGDVIYVYDTPASAIEEGDVITYRSGEGPTTTHRVVEVRESGGDIEFKTKGDANEEADAGTVDSGRLVGSVGFYVPWIGRVLTFAGTRNGLIAMVIVPSALLILSELVNIGSILRGSEEEPTMVDGSHQESSGDDIHE
jgi:signal peptidase